MFKLYMWVGHDLVEPPIDSIIKALRPGKIGDGEIFVMPVERWYASGPGRPAKRRFAAAFVAFPPARQGFLPENQIPRRNRGTLRA
jgi:hypothetical protein